MSALAGMMLDLQAKFMSILYLFPHAVSFSFQKGGFH